MLTGLWLNEWLLKLVGVVCDVLLRATGTDAGMPRSNEDVHWY